MGMAIGFNKKVLQILSTESNEIDNLPFDIGSHTTLSYNQNNIDEESDKIIKLLEGYLEKEATINQ